RKLTGLQTIEEPPRRWVGFLEPHQCLCKLLLRSHLEYSRGLCPPSRSPTRPHPIVQLDTRSHSIEHLAMHLKKRDEFRNSRVRVPARVAVDDCDTVRCLKVRK